jgi:Na+/melibiose symporter-like transporter
MTTATEHKNPAAPKISLKNKLAFAAGDIFGGGSFNIINFLFVPFLTLTVGIKMYWVGIILLISKFWDGLIDPFIGQISDAKKANRFGKRRYFMLICAPVLVVALILLFFPWNLITDSQPLKIMLTIIVYLLYATTQSFILIPYYSLGSEMSADFLERTNINSVRLGFSIFSSVICVAVPGMIAGPEKGPASYIIMAAVFGMFFCIAVLITALFAKEQIVSPAVSEKISIKNFFKPLKMKTYRYYLAMQMCSSMGMAVMSSYFFTYCDYWLRRGSFINTLMFDVGRFPIATVAAAVMFAAQILALPLYFALIKKRSKTFAYRTGAVIWSVLAICLFFLPAQKFTLIDANLNIISQTPDVLIIILAFILGLGIGGAVLVPHTLFGDVCDAGQLYFGSRQEGAFSGLSNFLNTTAQALGLAVASWIIGFSGYIETVYTQPTNTAFYYEKVYQLLNKSSWIPIEQPKSALLAIRIVMAFLPIIIMGIGFLVSLRYKLTQEKQKEILYCVELDKNSDEYTQKRQEVLTYLNEIQ